jgi:hypothetical protein
MTTMLFPHTESRRITLRSAAAKDAPTVYGILFRLGRGDLPMIDAFTENFGRGLSACFLIHDRKTDEVVGVSTLSNLTPAGHVRAEVFLSAGTSVDLLTDAYGLSLNFAFAMWRTRKVYVHTTEADVEGLGLGSEHASMIRVEALLTDHVFFHGRLWDVSVLAVYREQWDTHGLDLLKQIS